MPGRRRSEQSTDVELIAADVDRLVVLLDAEADLLLGGADAPFAFELAGLRFPTSSRAAHHLYAGASCSQQATPEGGPHVTSCQLRFCRHCLNRTMSAPVGRADALVGLVPTLGWLHRATCSTFGTDTPRWPYLGYPLVDDFRNSPEEARRLRILLSRVGRPRLAQPLLDTAARRIDEVAAHLRNVDVFTARLGERWTDDSRHPLIRSDTGAPALFTSEVPVHVLDLWGALLGAADTAARAGRLVETDPHVLAGYAVAAACRWEQVSGAATEAVKERFVPLLAAHVPHLQAPVDTTAAVLVIPAEQMFPTRHVAAWGAGRTLRVPAEVALHMAVGYGEGRVDAFIPDEPGVLETARVLRDTGAGLPPGEALATARAIVGRPATGTLAARTRTGGTVAGTENRRET